MYRFLSKLCRQVRSGQTRPHLISSSFSSGSGLVSSFRLSRNILLSYTLTCFAQITTQSSLIRPQHQLLHACLRPPCIAPSDHSPSHSHSLDPLAGQLAARPTTAPALDGRPSVIPWLRRLSSPTAIKFRRSRWHRTETEATWEFFLHGEVVGRSALGVCVRGEGKEKRKQGKKKKPSGW